ncbi:hypothetical protein BDW71DRAFT_210354 [Aspergillus fruticulosus]
MADPLFTTASIAGLVSLASSVFGVICQVSADLKDYEREVNDLQTEVRVLSVLLHVLSLLATAHETELTFDSSLPSGVRRLQRENTPRNQDQNQTTCIEEFSSGKYRFGIYSKVHDSSAEKALLER